MTKKKPKTVEHLNFDKNKNEMSGEPRRLSKALKTRIFEKSRGD